MKRATSEVVPRNNPCPCGSGRRYKECHGAIAPPVEVERIAPRSAYRPSGPDWDHLPELKRAECGQRMGTALQLQTAGRDADAERLYRDVLNLAPNTHDALHMLGVISLGRGDLVEAERLIKDAMALRQEYPAIKKNMRLVEDAIHARQQRDVRVVCELALPLLADAILSRAVRGNREASLHAAQPAEAASRGDVQTHVISDFGDPAGEREWCARRLAALLSPRRPILWSIQSPVDSPPDSRRMQTISAIDRQVPAGGVQILVGIDCDLDGWFEQTSPERLLVFGLAASPARYLEQLRHLAACGAPPIELIFRSRAEARRFGRVGPVLVPPIALAPQPVSIDSEARSSRAAFTLGTVIREERTVRAGDDEELLKALAGGACRLSILAPGQTRFVLGGNPAIEFHSQRELPLDAFLMRIDALLHRVPDPWAEGCGLALFGAMARGLPVLCTRGSLYAEYIEHERNGLLYADDAEVIALIQRLRIDAEWARAIGDGARARAAELFDTATLATAYTALVENAPIEVNS